MFCLRLDALHLCGRLYGRSDNELGARSDVRREAETAKACGTEAEAEAALAKTAVLIIPKEGESWRIGGIWTGMTSCVLVSDSTDTTRFG